MDTRYNRQPRNMKKNAPPPVNSNAQKLDGSIPSLPKGCLGVTPLSPALSINLQRPF